MYYPQLLWLRRLPSRDKLGADIYQLPVQEESRQGVHILIDILRQPSKKLAVPIPKKDQRLSKGVSMNMSFVLSHVKCSYTLTYSNIVLYYVKSFLLNNGTSLKSCFSAGWRRTKLCGPQRLETRPSAKKRLDTWPIMKSASRGWRIPCFLCMRHPAGMIASSRLSGLRLPTPTWDSKVKRI